MDDQVLNRDLASSSQRVQWRGTELGDKIETKSHQISDRLMEVSSKANAALQDYLRFKMSHGDLFGRVKTGETPILRAPVYPDSHIMTFSILASMVLVEGLANAYFFSKGSDLGLLGGWIQAITVAATNIAVGFFLIGFLGIRMIQNTKHRYFPITGWALILTGVVAVLLINLSAAHYRDDMELEAQRLDAGIDSIIQSYNGDTNFDDPVAGTSESRFDTPAPFGAPFESAQPVETIEHNPLVQFMANGPFATLEALLLFVLGLTFAVIAAFKGATFDDRIIGYGAAHRRLVKSASQLTATLKQLPKEAMSEEELDAAISPRSRAIALRNKIDDLFAQETDFALDDFDQACDQRHGERSDDLNADDNRSRN